MRERRVYEDNQLIFDAAKEVLDGRGKKGQRLLHMKKGPMSYETSEGVVFRKNHPFNWVSEGEADTLLAIEDPFLEFKTAEKEDAEDWYAF